MTLLNTQQAADRLGVSVVRIRQLIRAGKLEAQNLGRDYAINETALASVTVYGKPGRPKKAEGEGELTNLPAVTAAEMEVGDVVRELLEEARPKKRKTRRSQRGGKA